MQEVAKEVTKEEVTRMPLTFFIEGNQVYFQEGEMPAPSHFGTLYKEFLIGDNQYEVKKFNIETGEYEHTEELQEYSFFGKIVTVEKGYFIAEPPKQQETETKNEQQERELDRDELLLEQHLLLLQIALNTGGAEV